MKQNNNFHKIQFKIQKMKVRKLILFFILISYTSAAIRGAVSSSNQFVNSLTTLEFDIDRWSPSGNLLALTTIEIAFPSPQFAPYFQNFAGNTTLKKEKCQPQYGFGEGEELICVVDLETNRITVILTKDSSLTEVGFLIRDILNPDSASQSAPMTIKIFDPQGELIDSSENPGSSIFEVQTVPDTLQSVTILNSNKVVGQYGELSVTVVTKHHVVGYGDVRMRFPRWDKEFKIVPYFLDGVCKLIFDGRSNINPEAECEVQPQFSEDIVLIRNAVKDIEAGASISFIIEKVRNAPSTRGVSKIEVNTQTPESFLIDQMLDLSYSPLYPAVIPSANLQFGLLNAQVATLTNLTMDLTLQNPAPQGSLIKITFPPEIKIKQDSQVYLKSIYKSGKNKGNLDFSISSDQGKETVSILGAFQEYKDPGSKLLLDFSLIQTPSSSGETSSFAIQIMEFYGGEYFQIDANNQGITVRTEAQQLTDYVFQASQRQVFAAFTAQVSVKFKGILKINNKMKLSIPDQLQLDNKQFSCRILLETIENSASCVLDGRNIFITNFVTRDRDFTETLRGGLITFVLENLFVNSGSEQPIDVEFQIEIDDQSDQTIAYYNPSGQVPQYSAQAISIKQFLIESQDEVTGNFAEFILSGFMLPGQQVEAGMKLKITLPPQVSMGDEVSCLPRVCQKIDQNTINVLIEEQIVGPKKFEVKIQELRNPYSTQTTSSFQVQMETSQGYLIGKQTEDLTLSVSEGSSFNSVSIERGSEVNGVQTFYHFSIDLKNPIPDNAVLTILPPPEITIAAQQGTYVDCDGQGFLKTSQLCILSNKHVTVNLQLNQSSLEANSIVELIIYGVGNPKSLKMSKSFQLQILSSDSAYVYSKQLEGITVTNSAPNVIEVAEIQATNSTLGADSSYTVDFMPANSLPDNAVIQVTLPDSLMLSTTTALECIGIKNLKVGVLECTYDSSNHEVNIFTGLKRVETQTQETSFEINGFVNPLEPSFQQSFKIRTYDKDFNLIDVLPEGVSVTQACDYPCKTCGLSRKTCLSCQLDNIYKYLHDNVCLEECPPGQYGDPNFSCSPCSSECRQCQNSPTFCTECSAIDSFLHTPSGKCADACPEGQYNDMEILQCVNCNPECSTCSSSSQCLTCKSGFFLNQGMCIERCPISMIPSKDNTKCISCQDPCKQCKETVDQCTSCDLSSKYAFLYGFKCLEECPRGYIPSLSDGSTCELVQEDVIPFIFMSIAFLTMLMIGASKLCMKKLHYKNTLIALLTIICQANWIYLVYLTVKESMWQSTVVLLYGLGCSYLLNALFFCLYCKVMRQDKYYMQWRSGKSTQECLLVFFALLTSFQLYRLIFQQLSKAIKLQKEKPIEDSKVYKFQDENTVKSIFNKLTVIMISCVLAPVIVQNIYNLFFTHPGRQLFWEDIESICITFFLLVIMAYDSAKKTSKIEAKKLQTPQQININPAGVPVDLTEKENEVRQLHSMFQDTKDVKKFRDILMTMIQTHGSKLHFNSNDSGEHLEETNTFGQRKRTRNLELATVEDYRQVPVETTSMNITDRELLATVTDRNFIQKNDMFSGLEENLDLDRKYKSNVDEQEEDRKSEDDYENVMSTPKQENVSTVERDVHHDVNREQIHGMPDTGQLKNIGMLSKVNGQENVRESQMLGGRVINTHDTIEQKDKLQDRLDGEVRKSTPSMPPRVATHFSVISGENSLDQREGGQQFTKSEENQNTEPDLLSKAQFQINMIQIDEEQSRVDHSVSDSKEKSPIMTKPAVKSSIMSPKTEDYIKDDIEMLEDLRKFEKKQMPVGPSQKEQLQTILDKKSEETSYGSKVRNKTFASRDKTEQKKMASKLEEEGPNERPLTADIMKVENQEDLKVVPQNVLLKQEKWMVSTFEVQNPGQQEPEKNSPEVYTFEVQNSVKKEQEKRKPKEEKKEVVVQSNLQSTRLQSRERRDTLIKELFKLDDKPVVGGINFDDRFNFFARGVNSPQRNSLGKSSYLSSQNKSFSPKMKLKDNGIPQNIVETYMPESYGKPVKQSSKYASDFKRDYSKIAIPEEKVIMRHGIRDSSIDELFSNRKSFKSQKDQKLLEKEVKIPSISRTSSQQAPLMRIGSKNAQELQYMEKIAGKDLMSPDLKLQDLNKNITFTKRSDRQSFKSKTSRRTVDPQEKIEEHRKNRNSKSFENPKVDIYPNANIMSPRMRKTTPDQDILDQMLLKAEVSSQKSRMKNSQLQERIKSGNSNLQERIKSGNKEQREARLKLGQEIMSGSKRESRGQSKREDVSRGQPQIDEFLRGEKQSKSNDAPRGGSQAQMRQQQSPQVRSFTQEGREPRERSPMQYGGEPRQRSPMQDGREPRQRSPMQEGKLKDRNNINFLEQNRLKLAEIKDKKQQQLQKKKTLKRF